MNVLDINEQALRRKMHNRKILKKMEKGESLSSYNPQSSWFPPRPIIKKDEKALSGLYRKDKSFSLRNKKDKPSFRLLTLTSKTS